MARQMENAPCDFCFEHCPHMRLNVDTEKLYGDNAPVAIINTVYCEHEIVCKMWNDAWKESLL